jgi:hypothetical protein
MINAINHMYIIKSTDESLDIDIDTQKLKINFWNKIKLIFDFRPNQKMKMFMKKGY